MITIKAGESVLWTMSAVMPHTVTAGDNSWDSGDLSDGQTYSHTFTKAGTYPVTLTVRDAENESASVTQDVTVAAPPVVDQPKVARISVRLAPKGRKLVMARAEVGVVDAAGKKRLIMFSGLHPIRMAVSEDDGATWRDRKSVV